MRFRLSLLWAFLFLIAAGPAVAFEYSDCAGQICQWDSYPISYYVRQPLGVDLADGPTVTALRKSIERWNYDRQTFCAPLEFRYDGRRESETPGAQDNRNTVFFETDLWLFGKQALAVTTLWFDNTGTLREADIAFNAMDYRWSLDTNDPQNAIYEIRPTLTHEAGHFWGLDHTAVKSATMYAYYTSRFRTEDLDEDDIQAAAELFCGEPLPADDADEPNDGFYNSRALDGRTELSNNRLYDDDWYILDLQAGRRLKVTITDESADRFKSIELWESGDGADSRERCDGDCAQVLGEAGEARKAWLRITGDYDEHGVRSATYSALLEQVLPGEEGELTDDDEPGGDGDDDDDSGRGCATLHAGRGPLDLGMFVLLSMVALLVLRRRRR